MEMEIKFPGGARVEADYKGFTVLTDQPVKDGGDNSAPAPFDLFLTSLGTCAGIYVLNFLRKRDLPTDQARLYLTTEEDRERHMLTGITIRVGLPPEVPHKYGKAILSTVNLCTVKKQLRETLKVRTILEIGGVAVAGTD